MATRLRYPELAPEGYAALAAFGHYVNTATALEPVLLALVYLRASLLNGCRYCIEAHKAELHKHHEPASRIEAVETTPESDVFTPREQAALRWTEVITRLRGSHASEEDYAAVTRFFHDKDLVDLTFAIANINAWNRMGVAFKPEWRPRGNAPASVRETQSGQGTSSARTDFSHMHADRTAATPEAEDDGGKVATH